MALQKDAPYQQSRAALRQIYGSRTIDASAPQSARDSTPSGKATFRQQQGATPDEAMAAEKRDFRKNFEPRLGMAAQTAKPATLFSTQPTQSTDGMPDTDLFERNAQMLASLVPPSPPPEQMAEFLPATTGPLGGFGLPRPRPYLGGILQAANKWSLPA